MRLLIISKNKVMPEFKEVKLHKRGIAQSMQQGWYDAGPHGSRTNSRSFGPNGRSIKAQLSSERNIEINKFPNATAAIGTVNARHAMIQDAGGTIPERWVRRKKMMRFVYHGRLMFAGRVGPSRIRPKQYIVRGIQRVKRNFKLIAEFVWIKKVAR